MLEQETVDNLKKNWLTFEQINEISNRLSSIENGKAKFLNEEEFWNWVYEKINFKTQF